jgi:hypothetical protein
MVRVAVRLALMGVLLLSSGASAAQDGRAIFRPLLADPHEPGFFATYLFARTSHLAPRIGSVGFGQTIELVDARDPSWQVAVSAGVFSQFDLATTTTHLMNTDYIIGVPVSRRWGARSARLRIYHQSSHLGEEFPDGGAVRRQLLSFEALEVLLADELANWRVYGGGEYRFQHTPGDLAPAVAHAGLEYGGRTALVRLGRAGDGRLVTALDAKSFEDRGWQVGWSLKTGLSFESAPGNQNHGPHWDIMLTAYRGPTPYGQFYRENLSSVGLGLELTL